VFTELPRATLEVSWEIRDDLHVKSALGLLFPDFKQQWDAYTNFKTSYGAWIAIRVMTRMELYL
jgi:hypothetical protein